MAMFLEFLVLSFLLICKKIIFMLEVGNSRLLKHYLSNIGFVIRF